MVAVYLQHPVRGRTQSLDAPSPWTPGRELVDSSTDHGRELAVCKWSEGSTTAVAGYVAYVRVVSRARDTGRLFVGGRAGGGCYGPWRHVEGRAGSAATQHADVGYVTQHAEQAARSTVAQDHPARVSTLRRRRRPTCWPASERHHKHRDWWNLLFSEGRRRRRRRRCQSASVSRRRHWCTPDVAVNSQFSAVMCSRQRLHQQQLHWQTRVQQRIRE